jgi:hypothetical protein
MCGLVLHRPALPNGLFRRRGGKAVMTVPLWGDTQQARRRSNSWALFHPRFALKRRSR